MKLAKGAHVHLMGICGTAMAGLAGLLKDMGYRVTGSDENVYPPMSTLLQELGIPIMQGYRKENLQAQPDLVIVGNVISPKSEESQALVASNIPRMSMPEAFGEFLIDQRKSIVIAGTHGKTTTTAMLAWVAQESGKQPGFMVGGIPKNFNRSFQVPKGDYFVIEGDEYETCFFDKGSKFMHYRPYGVVLQKVELDHIEYFLTFERLKEAFANFLKLIPNNGILLMAAGEPTIEELRGNAKCERQFTFGIGEGDYEVRNLTTHGVRCEFDVYFRGDRRDHLTLNLLGNYNALNATAAYAMATQLGWDSAHVVRALASFSGVKRRQEIIGEPRGILLVEDFAHHPTAVKLTVDSALSRFPGQRIVAVLEPRSATSCRKIFQEPYFEALRGAHMVVIAPPNSFRAVPEEERLSTDKLVDDLRGAGVDAHSIREVDAIVAKLRASTKTGDVVLLMSNGAFGGIYQKLLAALA